MHSNAQCCQRPLLSSLLAVSHRKGRRGRRWGAAPRGHLRSVSVLSFGVEFWSGPGLSGPTCNIRGGWCFGFVRGALGLNLALVANGQIGHPVQISWTQGAVLHAFVHRTPISMYLPRPQVRSGRGGRVTLLPCPLCEGLGCRRLRSKRFLHLAVGHDTPEGGCGWWSHFHEHHSL